MNTLSFTARTISVETNDDYEYNMIALADDPVEYENYIIIQDAFEYDTQDILNGMDAPYVEINDDADYNRIKKVIFSSESLELETNFEDMENVSINLKEIEIPEGFVEMLTIIFKDKLQIK